MRTHGSISRRGQALVMVTLALFAMSGLIGLAVDLGWSYFSRKTAQSAADASALAAVNQAMDAISSGTASLSCGTGGLGCLASATGCGGGTTGNLQSACQYAQQNGFTAGGLPSSLQIVARAYAEPLALRVGYAYQSAHDWHLRVPPMAAG